LAFSLPLFMLSPHEALEISLFRYFRLIISFPFSGDDMPDFLCRGSHICSHFSSSVFSSATSCLSFSLSYARVFFIRAFSSFFAAAHLPTPPDRLAY